ncbi:MAG: hypothetical protein EOP54_04100 [Sphingobacteriales bacterium]|nr:MAG: hypothetical protein EOP54_04100 [Sphingobacteriales bacterium]
MKTLFYPFLILLLFAGACKKTRNNNKNNYNNSSLIPSSSGWTKVASIANLKAVSGLPGGYAMTPYDLAVVDGQLALLYSEDYKLSGVQGHRVYKVKFTPGGTLPASIPLQRGGWNFSYVSRFIPESFTTVYMKLNYTNSIYEALIYTDDAGPIAGNNLGYSTPGIWPINWYADGGLTMSVRDAGPANGNLAYTFSYTFPNPGNFQVEVNQWSLDSTSWRTCDALRLSGGAINQLIISEKNDQVYFSIIKQDATAPPQHSFSTLLRQEMTELNGAKFGGNSVIASTVVNDKYTVLVGEVDGTAITKVHCYQWQNGSNQFTKLYGDVSVPEDVGRQLMSRATIGVRPIEGADAAVKFTPDGTAYMLFSYVPTNTSDPDKYTALATFNASGTKITGKYTSTNNGDYEQFGLTTCQYFNGAYYAVVYQKRELIYDIDDPKFRLEIVKINP